MLSTSLEQTVNGFDPRDSSDANFSYGYRKGLDDPSLKSKYQDRLRQRIEEGVPRVNDPVSYTQLMGLANQKMTQFVRQDGVFDIDAYLSSELFEEVSSLGEKKLVRQHAANLNNAMDQLIAEGFKDFYLTTHTINQAQYIAQRTCELCKAAEKGGSYEISMYLGCDVKEVAETGKRVARDVYIDEQVVSGVRCEMTGLGEINIFEQLSQNNQALMGWAHSHAFNPIFYSDLDDRTVIKPLVNRISTHIKDGYFFQKNQRVNYGFTFVVNKRGDDPAFRVLVKRPRYYEEGGVLKVKSETHDFERTPSEGTDHENHWPDPRIITDDKPIDRKNLDHLIINSIIFEDGSRLSDFYKDETGNLVRELPKYGEYTRYGANDALPETKPEPKKAPEPVKESKLEQELRGEKVVELPKPKAITPELIKDDYADLTGRVTDLETENSALKSRINELAYSFESILGYKDALMAFYAPLMQSEKPQEMALGTIAKLLSGEYRANIDKIINWGYGEDLSQKRIRSWDTRMRAINAVFFRYKEDLRAVDSGLLRRLQNIIGKKRYLLKDHRENIRDIHQFLEILA